MSRFDETQWRNVDLNLLVAFAFLYRYQSVSLAAEKHCVSQSAMSHSLARLRALLNDDLFVRVGHKMVATDHAHSLYPLIDGMLQSLSQNVLTQNTFEAASYQGVCSIYLRREIEKIKTKKH